MYKVFLVDDEIVVREGIRDNVSWGATDFTFVGEASDGEMALPLIQEIKPDIVLTDIKMPFMDGLQLSRIIKKSMPWIKIIILSGHDEFNFAKEAISVGVAEYLLKPINSSELVKSLNKVAAQIEHEKEERIRIDRLKDQLKDNSELLKEKFLNELSMGLVSSGEAIEKCGQFNMSIISRYYMVELIESEIKDSKDAEAVHSEYLKLESIMAGIVDGNPDIIRFKRNMEETVLVFKGESVSALEENAYAFAQSIKYEVERNTGTLLTIGIGSARERIQGIAESFGEAEKAKNYKYVFGKNKIIGIRDIKTEAAPGAEIIKLDKINVGDFLRYGRKSNIQEFLSDYTRCLSEPNLKSLIYTYYAFMDIVMTASRFVNEIGGSIEELAPEVLHLDSVLMNMEYVGNLKELAGQILVKVLDYRDSKIDSKYGSTISKAKEYIGRNFSDPEISLHSVASFVNISPSHFSTIFSQETGTTFIEHLTQVRIKKAMELLKTTRKKSSEIAYGIGYNDPHYFSYLFKKITGHTPKEYRNDEGG